MTFSWEHQRERAPGLASSVMSDGPVLCQRRHILCAANTSLYPSDVLKNESFDLISDTEHPSETSCGRTTPESCQMLAPHDTRTPVRRASLSTRFLASHMASSILGGSFATSTAEPRRQRVNSVGVASDQGIRSTMEDEHVVVVDADVAFFGVYDGHGGRQCAAYVRDHLHPAVLQHDDLKLAPRRALSDAFAQIERDFLALSEEEQNAAGCVCAAVVVQGDLLTVGNVGDCEVVLARAGEPVLLTVKHNPSCNDAEATRVTNAGGCIVNRRVGHPRLNPRVCSLAVSRAVGDAGFKLSEYTLGKPSGLIADADTSEVVLTAEDRFLLIACDGLWDTMTYAEAIQMCTQLMDSGADANAIADKLVGEALMRGTRDNITVVFVSLEGELAAVKK